MTDSEICDAIGVPEDQRAELLTWLHAWAKSYIPGPNAYAIQAVLMWQQMQKWKRLTG